MDSDVQFVLSPLGVKLKMWNLQSQLRTLNIAFSCSIGSASTSLEIWELFGYLKSLELIWEPFEIIWKYNVLIWIECQLDLFAKFWIRRKVKFGGYPEW